MGIEDITNPKVFKFWFDTGQMKISVESTGIVKRFLSAKIQPGSQLAIWAEVVPSCMKSRIECAMIKTGDDVPDGYQYVSTVRDDTGFIYHIYANAVMHE